MKFFVFLLSIPLLGASLIIDSGSATDQYFTGGTAFAVTGADTTIRFSNLPFSYKIPAVDGTPYIVKFNFLEPSTAPPARIFSVTINDQLVFPRITMGTPAPFSRSVIVMPAEGFINITFTTVVRSAVISSIEVTSLFSSTLVSDWQTCKSSGFVSAAGASIPPGWSCDVLQSYTFTLQDGTIDGPYVAVKMPPGFVLDPMIWVKQ